VNGLRRHPRERKPGGYGRPLWSSLACLALVSALTSACGAAHETNVGTKGHHFAVLRVATQGPDYLDPGLSYTAEGWIPMFGVYLTLLGYRQTPGPAGATLVPVLARNLPRISADGRTYNLWLRRGLRYSDGRPVRASDFAWTVRRLFLLDSAGVGFFGDVVGAARFQRTKRGRIAGIRTDDATGRITIELVHPRADFANVLAALFSAPVPRGTPWRDQSSHPIPATGPYQISSYRPGREFVLVRNSRFRPVGGVPAGNPDRVAFEIIGDGAIALEHTIRGQIDWDSEQIPADRLGEVQQRHGSHLRLANSPNTFYFFLNTRTPPFDRLGVRRAVNYAIDRAALVQLAGGLGRPTENVLPPGYPQFRRHRLYPHALAKARRLVGDSGSLGAHVTVWGPDFSPAREQVEYLADVLNRIGLRARVQLLAPAIYFTAVSNQRTHAQIGWTNWFPDYPHPADWFDALFHGTRITAAHNTNLSNADVPQINGEIEALVREPHLTADVNRRWSRLDRMVLEQALIAPFMNGVLTEFFGPAIDMRCYAAHEAAYVVLWARACKN
jgi:peptide/nickel transport system substrate-binding protein